MITIDGNEAAASVAHRVSEVIAIYPITPSSPMGEFSDEWTALGKKNIWGARPDVTEMQSEAGAAAAVHGALQAGALTTTFTASQGLLLMIPSMFKIAGELTSFAMHVTARTLATHALSIFGDHSDVMACRQIGFAMLCSGSVQEVHDLACVSHSATLRSRIPFLHFFDGFRTSHEVAKMEELTNDDLHAMMDADAIQAHRQRALSPDHPVIRGTAQNPDTYFQAREACNRFYMACPTVVQETMDRFARVTGRAYHLFDYVGHPEAERVIVLMGSGAETSTETVDHLIARGEKVGLLKVRLYRPFSVSHFVAALPKTVKSLAVLDRTKEPGALGEPLYLDVVAGLQEAVSEGLWTGTLPAIVGGRYGLSSKEFSPAMVKAVFDELKKDRPLNHFTVGINDDVTHLSLPVDSTFDIEPSNVVRCMFYGLGADGTVGANKNSIKIIGEETENFAQGYFVYDSKKSGAGTVSHLRFGPKSISSSYLVRKANFIGCHQFTFMEKLDVLEYAAPGATFLLNSPYSADQVWGYLPCDIQRKILDLKLKLHVIDAYKVAGETGMGTRINTIMQTCFFAISGVLPRDEAIAQIKYTIKKTYGKKGDDVVQKNYQAVDDTLAHLHEVKVPEGVTSGCARPPIVSAEAPEFVKKVSAEIMAGRGDLLPVSAFPVDGTWPVGTTQWEKRNIAQEIPAWDPQTCIQCNKCSFICPHAAIRSKVYDPKCLAGAPETFKSVDYKAKDFAAGSKFTIQVAPEDCTGCALCTQQCPGKNKANPALRAITMTPQLPLREKERSNYTFFLNIPDVDRTKVRLDVKGSQFLLPLFEYSGACSGCGETPYVKLLSQLFGDRAMIGNATGCSSIYGGNLPTTPYTTNRDGRGPTWSNSLFEDAAEFSYGFRLAADSHKLQARHLLKELSSQIGDGVVELLLLDEPRTEVGIAERRAQIAALRTTLAGIQDPRARRLEDLADYLARKSVWALGGDGWAYDIGYGGLDHVIANMRDINLLVMDTEVYSNTGGQASKATPIGASAKFAVAGKEIHKKDLGHIAMTYGHVYVASVAMGARDAQTVKAFVEADSYDGPSIIIAYSHCIAHGFELNEGAAHQKMAVESGIWPLYRFDPRRIQEGLPPLQIDAKPTGEGVVEFMRNETRFKMIEKQDPARFAELVKAQERYVRRRIAQYEEMAKIVFPKPGQTPAA
jgi:pyruvate-ferredoxin/flavodoxin oxidoreductase